MASPYAQTLSSLAGDSARLSRFTWLVSGAILLAWTAWFVFGAVATGAAADDAEVTAAGPAGSVLVTASYPPAVAWGTLRDGMAARVTVPGDTGGFPAVVREIASEAGNGAVAVTIEIAAGRDTTLLRPGVPVEVTVTTGAASPAALLLRAAGLSGGAEPRP